MPRTAFPTLAALALLAACGTPQEQCIAREGRELRTLTQLAEDTRANLSRGYGLEERQEVTERRRRCEGTDDAGNTFTYRCDKVEVETVQVPVTLNLTAEAQKLEQLEARIARERARVQAAAATCRQVYPD